MRILPRTGLALGTNGRVAGAGSMTMKHSMIDCTKRNSFVAGNQCSSTGGTILHPTDYSTASRRAFELACRVALERGSRLIVMHVAPPVTMSIGLAPPPPLPPGYRGAWESRLRMLLPTNPGVRVEYRLEEGDVPSAILRVARESNCDLIVMAGRTRTWLQRMVFGSVAADVESKAPCPVLRVDTHQPEGGNDGRLQPMIDNGALCA
jgi:nucleotide-binding universal stress UspA family protein